MLILKSASPRRQQILKDLKLKFLAEPSHINEDARIKESPLSYLQRVTIAKLELEKQNQGKFIFPPIQLLSWKIKFLESQ